MRITLALGLLFAQVNASHHAVEFGHDDHAHDEHGSCVFPLASAEIVLLPHALQKYAFSVIEPSPQLGSLSVARRAATANLIRAPPAYI